LIEKAIFCAALEQRTLQDESLNAEECTKGYDALSPLPAALEPQMRARLQAVVENKACSDKALRTQTEAQMVRCLKIEVMLDLPTPDAYSKQRMAFQIERLSASMKKNTQAQESLEELKQGLLLEGPVELAVFDSIWARIDAILSVV
jgi:hypothetical protein